MNAITDRRVISETVSVNVRCVIIGDQVNGPYILPQRLSGNIYEGISKSLRTESITK